MGDGQLTSLHEPSIATTEQGSMIGQRARLTANVSMLTQQNQYINGNNCFWGKGGVGLLVCSLANEW